MAAGNLKSVAEIVGMHPTTVSRILREDARYSYAPETVERVLAAAKKVGYHPHSLAWALRAKRTHMIGLLHINGSGQYYSLLTQTLAAELQKREPYRAMFVDASELLNASAGSAFGIELLEGLFCPPNLTDAHTLDDVLARVGDKTQIVTIGHERIVPDLPRVVIQQSGAVEEAMEYLFSIGHTRIAILYRAPRKNNAKFTGYARALKKRGLVLDESLCLAMPLEYEPDSYLLTGQVLAERALSLSAPPTAILCANDEVAMGAIHGARQMGLGVPNDVSIIGFDNIPLSRFTSPPLTTIEQPFEAIAQAAVDLMLEQLERPQAGRQSKQRPIACHLRIRQSSGAAKKLSRKI